MASSANPGQQMRTELNARIDRIARDCAAWPPRRIADALEDIRRDACHSGMIPAVTVIHAIDAALARGERGPRVIGGLDILRDAIACDSADAPACEAFAALCSVRLRG